MSVIVLSVDHHAPQELSANCETTVCPKRRGVSEDEIPDFVSVCIFASARVCVACGIN